MSTRPALAFALAAASIAATLLASTGDDKKPPAGPAPLAQPVAKADQCVLAGREGEYDTTITFLQGKQPMGDPSKGKAKVSAVVGGRFFQLDETGTMMGDEYTAMKLFGFNDEVGAHESNWVYTGSNAMMRMSGKRGADGTVTMDATYAGKPGAMTRFTIVVKTIDADRFSIELVGGEGDEAMTEQAVYTRRKS